MPRALDTADTELARLGTSLSYDPQSHNSLRDGNMCSKTPVSTLYVPDNAPKASALTDIEAEHLGASLSSYLSSLTRYSKGSDDALTYDSALSECKDAFKALVTAMTDPDHLEVSLKSCLRSQTSCRANKHAKTSVSTTSEPGNAPNGSPTPKSESKSMLSKQVMGSQPRSCNDSREGNHPITEVSNVYNEARALLLNPKDYSLLDSAQIRKYLPYAPDTVMYALSSDLAEEYEFLPATAALTSTVRKDKSINDCRKIFRRLGRDLYGIRMPTSDETRYPSQSCEAWASHIFNLLDTVVTFRPTCRITNKLTPAQEIDFWPEYGELHIAYMQLINQSLVRQCERNSLLPIPEWPASDCLFHAKAFEVAAVSFRDQMERSIQKLYDILTLKISDQAPTPTVSTKTFDCLDPVQGNLHDQTLRLKPDSSLIIPDMHTTNRTSNALVKSVRSDLIPQDTYSRPCRPSANSDCIYQDI
ncbi:hypothetical protein RSAG8_08171, partial [Rhizoctonia solani AG-8 WAC10335]